MSERLIAGVEDLLAVATADRGREKGGGSDECRGEKRGGEVGGETVPVGSEGHSLATR